MKFVFIYGNPTVSFVFFLNDRTESVRGCVVMHIFFLTLALCPHVCQNVKLLRKVCRFFPCKKQAMVGGTCDTGTGFRQPVGPQLTTIGEGGGATFLKPTV